MTSTRRPSPVVAVTATCAAILVAFGVYAKAQTTPSGAEQQLAQLRQQLVALEKRVAELEKPRGTGGGVQSGAATGQKAGPPQLGGPERAPASADTAPGANKPTVVTAPFIVVDRNGKVVMRVQGEAVGNSLSRGIYAFNATSDVPMAHLGVTADGDGRAYVTHAGAGRPAVQMIGGGADNDALILVTRGRAEGYNSLEQEGLMIRNDDGIAAGSIVVKSGTGYLALNDKAGNPMVDAGTLQSQKGYVRTSPYRSATSIQGNPSVLMGGNK